jgi:hypothetical protein
MGKRGDGDASILWETRQWSYNMQLSEITSISFESKASWRLEIVFNRAEASWIRLQHAKWKKLSSEHANEGENFTMSEYQQKILNIKLQNGLLQCTITRKLV